MHGILDAIYILILFKDTSWKELTLFSIQTNWKLELDVVTAL